MTKEMAWVYVEARAAVERHERLARERELDDQHATRPAGRAVGDVLPHAVDARIGKQRDVEPRRLLGLSVEPEAGAILDMVGPSAAGSGTDCLAGDAPATAAMSIHITSQMWPSGSSKLRPYMKP